MESYTQIQTTSQKSHRWEWVAAVVISLGACFAAFFIGRSFAPAATSVPFSSLLTVESLPFAITDPHVHFMLVPNFSYPRIWPQLTHSWSVRDFNSASSGVAVDKMVFMEVICDTPIEEAQWVQSVANRGTESSDYRPGPNPSLKEGTPEIAGIIASARLEQGADAARADLATLLQTVPLLKGIRRVVQNDPDDMACMTANYTDGVSVVGNTSSLFVNMGIRKEQLKCLYLLALKFPNIRFLLDHIAKPDIANAVMEPWKSDLSKVANLPNVHVKISGLADQSQGDNDHYDSWTVPQFTPYVTHAIQAFGWDRVMFAGNWMEVNHYSSWRRWVEGLLFIVQQPPLSATPVQIQQLFRDNAKKFHGI